MIKIYTLLIVISSFLFSKVIVGQNIEPITLHNQFNKSHTIDKKTKKIIFVFTKENIQKLNGFLEKKDKDYLSSKDILFLIDIPEELSIFKWFGIDSLEQYKHSILVIDNKSILNRYQDLANRDKIMVITLSKLKIIGIDYFDDLEDFQNIVENN